MLILSALILIALWKILNKKYFILALVKRIQTQDGSPLESKVCVLPGKTIFGNNLDLLNLSPSMIFHYGRNNYKRSEGRSYLLYFVIGAIYNVVRAEDADEILHSPKLITKNIIYDLIRPFLGEGLLTSTDQKWHFRRKLLTPAFHFNILQSFVDIFKEESQKLTNFLEKNLGDEVNVNEFIQPFTLNNVCETALGVKLDNMSGGEQYRQSIHDLEEIMVERVGNLLMFLKPIFYLFGNYQKHLKNLKIAHDFSSRIIHQRRDLFKLHPSGIVDDLGRKKRYAMLDTLLAAEKEGLIDHQGICDEVNTFMFEGYDTTATCLIFTILLLALHEDVQQRCFDEIDSLSDNDKDMTVHDYNKLIYLECVIKESLRLFPPVAFFGRVCTEKCVVNGLIFPKETQIVIHAFDIMRDPRHFPDPNKFLPNRFLPENSANRHPFAFMPFSAGQRNCIGQKFAFLEMKVLLVSILRKFKLFPATRLEDIIYEYGIVLRSQKNIKVGLKGRESEN